MPAPVKHTITIRHRDDNPANELVFTHTSSDHNDQGDLQAGDPFRIQAGDKVEWTSKLGNFSVLFKDDAPFNGDIVSLGGHAGEFTSARVSKRQGGTPANPVLVTFEYAATVVEGPAGNHKTTCIDPLMEVSDSGGGV